VTVTLDNDTAGASFYGRGVPGRARLVVHENRRSEVWLELREGYGL
jgi:hypothetical protein